MQGNGEDPETGPPAPPGRGLILMDALGTGARGSLTVSYLGFAGARREGAQV